MNATIKSLRAKYKKWVTMRGIEAMHDYPPMKHEHHHGGTAVDIEDGVIVKGPAPLVGRRLPPQRERPADRPNEKLPHFGRGRGGRAQQRPGQPAPMPVPPRIPDRLPPPQVGPLAQRPARQPAADVGNSTSHDAQMEKLDRQQQDQDAAQARMQQPLGEGPREIAENLFRNGVSREIMARQFRGSTRFQQIMDEYDRLVREQPPAPPEAPAKEEIGKETGKGPFPKKFGKSKAKIESTSEATKINIESMKPGLLKEIPSLVGAPDDAIVSMTAGRSFVSVNIRHPKFFADRTITKHPDGSWSIHNDMFFVKRAHKNSGIGMEVFSRQVENASAMGFKYIDVMAGGSGSELASDPQSMNGFYTWARFGYNTSIEHWHNPEIRQKFPNAKSLQDIMATKEGREWWLKNGFSYSAKFDLSKDSRSMKVLGAYIAEREAKKKAGG